MAVILMSSRDDVDDLAAKLRAVAHLRKPVKADRLLELVALFAPPMEREAQARLTRTFDK